MPLQGPPSPLRYRVFFSVLVLSHSAFGGALQLAEPYPLVSGKIEKHADAELDDDGIPLLNFNGKLIYYPVRISQIALDYYNHYFASRDESSRNYFLKLADWLLANFEHNGDYGGWYTNDALAGSNYNLNSHWLSAMSQGFGLSVMLQAYSLTGDSKYLAVESGLLASFEANVAGGGVRSPWGNSYWYDEYPSSPEKHVLNGFLFALGGLHHYYCGTGSVRAKVLFDQGVEAMREHLPTFDAGFNSYYSQSSNQTTQHGIASATGGRYHALHVSQLMWLYRATGDQLFWNWAHQFYVQHMGVFKDSPETRKVHSIVASHTVEPDQHGVANLTDGNWTYGTYWSASQYPAELTVSFTRSADKLYKLVLVSAGEKFSNTRFTLQLSIGGKWVSADMKLTDTYAFKSRHHEAIAHTFVLDGSYNQVDAAKIRIATGGRDVIALRELNFIYDMGAELDQLYSNKWVNECARAGAALPDSGSFQYLNR